MREWLMTGIPRNIAENPDMEVVGRIRESLRNDTGQTCESDMLLPCPFCGCDRPFVQTHDFGEFTEEARVVCPSCHVATTREFQSWRVSYAGDDLTRTLAIGRAVSLWNRRSERTCRNAFRGRKFECSECGTTWHLLSRGDALAEWEHVRDLGYCPSCGARVIEEQL